MPYDPQLANKLLDYFGYKRGADGYRTWPNGKPLVWRYSSTPSSRDREIDELWQKSVERIGIRIHVDKNRFPEELKQERACQLLSRTASWIADYPDGDDFMQLFYGPNSHENNNACFQMAEWDRIYLKTKTMPDSPERNRLYRQLWRMVEVNGVVKMHDTRLRNMLVQPAVIGYKKHPILLADFIYVDIDNQPKSPDSRPDAGYDRDMRSKNRTRTDMTNRLGASPRCTRVARRAALAAPPGAADGAGLRCSSRSPRRAPMRSRDAAAMVKRLQAVPMGRVAATDLLGPLGPPAHPPRRTSTGRST